MKFKVVIADCDAAHIGKTGRSLETRKRAPFDAVKRMDAKNSALSQYIVNFDHFIAWDEAKIFKMEQRRTTEFFHKSKSNWSKRFKQNWRH